MTGPLEQPHDAPYGDIVHHAVTALGGMPEVPAVEQGPHTGFGDGERSHVRRMRSCDAIVTTRHPQVAPVATRRCNPEHRRRAAVWESRVECECARGTQVLRAAGDPGASAVAVEQGPWGYGLLNFLLP